MKPTISSPQSLTKSPYGYKMSKSCERWKQWDDYYYWNHTNDQDKYFFKVMVGSFQQRMIIPDKFAQRFRSLISRTIKLETRNGNNCNVEVTKIMDKLVLQSGWDAFVSAHDLKNGDFLVFKYSGSSVFKVLIFGPNGCEKVSSCVAMNNDAPPCVIQRRQDPLDISSSCHDRSMQSPGTERQARLQRDGSSKGNKNISIRDVSSSGNDQEGLSVPGCILPRRARLSQLQKKRLAEKVRAIHSEIPICASVMKKSSVSGNLCVLEFCKKYASEYLPKKKKTLWLQCQGKSWEVGLHIAKKHARRLSRGWRQFVNDNGVLVGDICLFELLKNDKRFVMNVYIIHKE